MRRGTDRLVRAARAGDESAWRELYARHAPRITALVATLPDHDWASSAEDLVAQAWLTAASKMADFEGSDDDFGGWLFTIARNHASNSHRTAVRRRTDPVDTGAAEVAPVGRTSAHGATASDGDPIGRVDEHDRLRRLLAHLSPREAEVVACIDVAGLDVATTARTLGMKPTAVRVARHRALGRLRRVLDEESM